MAKIILDPGVEDELWAIWAYIAEDDPEAATRVVEAAHETFKLLASNPELGRRRSFRNPRVRNVRSFRVSGFDNHLIFYRAVEQGIQVLHVYHGAQDLEALFGDR